MIRGTNVRFTFTIPKEINIEDISYIEVIAWQNGYKGTTVAPLPLKKRYTNQDWDSALLDNDDDYTLVVVLTSEDTARFTDKLKGYIQCKVGLTGKGAYATHEQKFTVYPMHSDMVGGDIVDSNTNNEGFIILDGQTIIDQ